MSSVNPPLVPIGLRELVKKFTKDLLSNKPQNIAEYAVEYFEKLLPHKPYEGKGFELYGYGEAVARTRKHSNYPISAVFAIFPNPLTQIIKEFIKAVIRENPQNLLQFAIEYFRQLKEEKTVFEVDYSSYINYTNSMNPLTVGQNITCTCGRTLKALGVHNVFSTAYKRNFNENKDIKSIENVNVHENVEKYDAKVMENNTDLVINNQVVKSVLILQKLFRLKLKRKREEHYVKKMENNLVDKSESELLPTDDKNFHKDVFADGKIITQNQCKESDENIKMPDGKLLEESKNTKSLFTSTQENYEPVIKREKDKEEQEGLDVDGMAIKEKNKNSSIKTLDLCEDAMKKELNIKEVAEEKQDDFTALEQQPAIKKSVIENQDMSQAADMEERQENIKKIEKKNCKTLQNNELNISEKKYDKENSSEDYDLCTGFDAENSNQNSSTEDVDTIYDGKGNKGSRKKIDNAFKENNNDYDADNSAAEIQENTQSDINNVKQEVEKENAKNQEEKMFETKEKNHEYDELKFNAVEKEKKDEADYDVSTNENSSRKKGENTETKNSKENIEKDEKETLAINLPEKVSKENEDSLESEVEQGKNKNEGISLADEGTFLSRVERHVAANILGENLEDKIVNLDEQSSHTADEHSLDINSEINPSNNIENCYQMQNIDIISDKALHIENDSSIKNKSSLRDSHNPQIICDVEKNDLIDVERISNFHDGEKRGNDNPSPVIHSNTSLSESENKIMENQIEETNPHLELHVDRNSDGDNSEYIDNGRKTDQSHEINVDNLNYFYEKIHESEDKFETKLAETVKPSENMMNELKIKEIQDTLENNAVSDGEEEFNGNEKVTESSNNESAKKKSNMEEMDENHSKALILKNDTEILLKQNDKQHLLDNEGIEKENIECNLFALDKENKKEFGNKITPTIETIIKEAEKLLGSSYSSERTEATLQQTNTYETAVNIQENTEHLKAIETNPHMTTMEEKNKNITIKDDTKAIIEENLIKKNYERLSLDSNETVDIASLDKNIKTNKLEIDQEAQQIESNEQLQKSSSGKSEISTTENLLQDNEPVYLDKSIKSENIQEVIQSSKNYENNDSEKFADDDIVENSLDTTENIVKLNENNKNTFLDNTDVVDNNCHLKQLAEDEISYNTVEIKSDSHDGHDENTNNLELNSFEKNPASSENSNRNELQNVRTITPNTTSSDDNDTSEYSIEQRINKDYFYTVGDLQLSAEKPERILDVILESPPLNEIDAINNDVFCHDALNNNARQFNSNTQLYDIMEENVILTDDIKECESSGGLILQPSENSKNLNDNSENISAEKTQEAVENIALENNKQDSVINENPKDTDNVEIVPNNNDEIAVQTISNLSKSNENPSKDEENKDMINIIAVNSSEDKLVFSKTIRNQENVTSLAQIDGLKTSNVDLSNNLDVIKTNKSSSIQGSNIEELINNRQSSEEAELKICQNLISSDPVNRSADKCLHDEQNATIKNEASLENNDDNDILSELKNLKTRLPRELLRSNTDSVITQLPDTEAFIKSQQNDMSMELNGDSEENKDFYDKMFSLEGDINEKIREKMFACSLSETNSDSFDVVVVDQVDENGSLPRVPYNDENIETALVNVSGNSTDTESTIVSAVTKLQANTRGYLTRQRLRREIHGAKSSAQDAQKASFGNAAINESLENLVKDAAAKKIQRFIRKVQQNRSPNNSRMYLTTSSSEYSLAARRMTLQRGDALRNDSLPEEETSSNELTHKNTKDQSKRVNMSAKTYINTSTDRRLMWQLIRRNSMPVQIQTDVFRVVPKHMKKRVSSAEIKTKSSTNFFNE